MLGRQFLEAAFQRGILQFPVFCFFSGFLGQFGHEVFSKDQFVAGHLAPIGERFETGNHAGPFDEAGELVELIKFPPGYESNLLDDLIGIMPRRQQ